MKLIIAVISLLVCINAAPFRFPSEPLRFPSEPLSNTISEDEYLSPDQIKVLKVEEDKFALAPEFIYLLLDICGRDKKCWKIGLRQIMDELNVEPEDHKMSKFLRFGGGGGAKTAGPRIGKRGRRLYNKLMR